MGHTERLLTSTQSPDTVSNSAGGISRHEKAVASAKTIFTHAQKLQTKNEELLKQAATKTREVLQDDRTKKIIKNIIADERTKNILKSGAMIGLAAAGAALVERKPAAATAAALAEHKRLSSESRNSQRTGNSNSSSPSVQEPTPAKRTHDGDQDTSPLTARSVRESHSPDTVESTWSAPEWTNLPESKGQDRVSGAPIKFLMNEAELWRIEKHPSIPTLYVEASRTDPRTYAIAIEWAHRVPRIFYTPSQIPETWTAIQHDEFLVPLELRTDDSSHIWIRWLAPSDADREALRENPYVPMDGDQVYRGIGTALRILGGGTRWHV